MAHSEACQLYIEEQIKEGLAEGKTPYSIGKELTAMIEKLFEATIPATTIEKKAERIRGKFPTSVGTAPTTKKDGEIKKNQEIKHEHGGKRNGAGRKPKYQSAQSDKGAGTSQYLEAMQFVAFAISHLERIRPDDPHGPEALDYLLTWIMQRKEEIHARGSNR